MYLTYERYALLGGEVEESAFPPLDIQAEALLSEWTSGRLDNWQASDERVEMALVIMIDDLCESMGQEVSSFSNGVDSFSFATRGGAYGDLYERITEMLPLELVSLVV